MPDNKWIQMKNEFFLTNVSNERALLPQGVYTMQHHDKKGIFLAQTEETFDFPYKIYGLERDFIERVIKTYNHTQGNMGVLLNGVKGTGKTVTAKLIANKLKLPVILISRHIGGMSEYLAQINQDVIIFFDEFEKLFNGENPDEDPDYRKCAQSDKVVLSIMDGALSTEYRKVFLLTTNELWIDDNLLDRPGRIRYKKEFRDLNAEQINEIIDDRLLYHEFKEDIIKFLQSRKIITVDIIKALIDEVNIHNESPLIFGEVMNIRRAEDHDRERYDLYLIEGEGRERLFRANCTITNSNQYTLEELALYRNNFNVNGKALGKVIRYKEPVITVQDYFENEESGKQDIKEYRIEKKEAKHPAFYSVRGM